MLSLGSIFRCHGFACATSRSSLPHSLGQRALFALLRATLGAQLVAGSVHAGNVDTELIRGLQNTGSLHAARTMLDVALASDAGALVDALQGALPTFELGGEIPWRELTAAAAAKQLRERVSSLDGLRRSAESAYDEGVRTLPHHEALLAITLIARASSRRPESEVRALWFDLARTTSLQALCGDVGLRATPLGIRVEPVCELRGKSLDKAGMHELLAPIEALNEFVTGEIEEAFQRQLCVPPGVSVCDTRNAESRAWSQWLLAAIKRDFANLRRLLFLFASESGGAARCELPEDWSNFNVDAPCLASLESAYGDASAPNLAAVLARWPDRAPLRAWAEGNLRCPNEEGCEGHTAVVALASALSVPPGRLLDTRSPEPAARPRLEDIRSALDALIRWSESSVRLTDAPDPIEIRFSASVDPGSGSALRLTGTVVQVLSPSLDGAIPNPRRCAAGAQTIPLGVRFVVVGTWDALRETLAGGAERFLSASDPDIVLDTAELNHWLRAHCLQGIPSLPVAPAWSRELKTGRISLIEGGLEIVLPWGNGSAGASGSNCELTWAALQQPANARRCIDRAISEAAETRLDRALDTWLRATTPGASVASFATSAINDWKGADQHTYVTDGDGVSFQILGGAITYNLTWEGNTALHADAAKITEALARRALGNAPFLRIQPEPSGASADIWWSLPGSSKVQDVLLGRASRDGEGWKIERPDVKDLEVPGVGRVIPTSVSFDGAKGITTVAASRATIAPGLDLRNLTLTIRSDLGIEVAFEDEELIEYLVHKEIAKIGLPGFESKSVSWVDQHLVLEVLDHVGRSHRIVFDHRWRDRVRDLASDAASEHALEQLFTKDAPQSYRAGAIVLARTCDAAACTLELRYHPEHCTIWTGQLTTEAEWNGRIDRDCARSWLSARWSASGDLSVQDISVNTDQGVAHVRLSVATLAGPVEGSAKLDLRSGGVTFEENLEARVLALAQSRAQKVLSGAALHDELRRQCDELLVAFKGVEITLDGKRSCSEVSFTEDLNREYQVGAVLPLGNGTALTVAGITWSATRGVSFERATIDAGTAKQAITALVAEPFRAGEVRISSRNSPTGFYVRADLPVALANGLPAVSVPVEIAISAAGVSLPNDIAAPFVSALMEQWLPAKADLGGLSLRLEKHARVEGDDVVVDVSATVAGFEALPGFDRPVPGELKINLRSGLVSLPRIDVGQLVDQGLNAILGRVLTTDLIQQSGDPKLTDCSGDSFERCTVRIPLQLNLSQFEIFPIQMPAVELVIDRRGARVDGPTQFTIPLQPEIPVGVVTLVDNQLTLGEHFLEIGSDVMTTVARQAVLVDAILRIDLSGNRGIEIGGPLRILSVPVGTTRAKLSAARGLTLSLDVGGPLKPVVGLTGCFYAGDDRCGELSTPLQSICASAPAHSTDLVMRGCARARLFQLLESTAQIRLAKSNELIVEADTNFVLFTTRATFHAGPGFSHPSLAASVGSFGIGAVRLGGIDVDVRLSGASFAITALGLRVQIVFPALHSMNKSDIENLILRLLLPDVDLKKLLDAILSGNVTVNPFSSFGKGGGEVSSGRDGGAGGGDSGDADSGGGDSGGGDSVGGGSTGGKHAPSAKLEGATRPHDYTGDGLETAGDFRETKPGGFQEKASGRSKYASDLDYSLATPGPVVLSTRMDGDAVVLERVIGQDRPRSIARLPQIAQGVRLFESDGSMRVQPLALWSSGAGDGVSGIARESAEAYVVFLAASHEDAPPLLRVSDLGFAEKWLRTEHLVGPPLPPEGRLFADLVESWVKCLQSEAGECKITRRSGDYASGAIQFEQGDKVEGVVLLDDGERVSFSYDYRAGGDGCNAIDELKWLGEQRAKSVAVRRIDPKTQLVLIRGKPTGTLEAGLGCSDATMLDLKADERLGETIVNSEGPALQEVIEGRRALSSGSTAQLLALGPNGFALGDSQSVVYRFSRGQCSEPVTQDRSRVYAALAGILETPRPDAEMERCMADVFQVLALETSGKGPVEQLQEVGWDFVADPTKKLCGHD